MVFIMSMKGDSVDLISGCRGFRSRMICGVLRFYLALEYLEPLLGFFKCVKSA